MTLPDDSNGSALGSKSFLGHLEDLRRAVMWSVAAIVLGILVAIPFAPTILSWMKLPLVEAGKDPDKFLTAIELTGGLSIAMSVILWSGAIISAPFVLFAAAWFVFPGLKAHEKRTVLDAFGFAVILFIMGVAVGYKMILGVSLQWMFQLNDWLGLKVEFITINSYVSFMLKMLLGFGLSFEFPVLILALAKVGVVSCAFLRDKRRHVVVILLIVSAIVTPTVDPVTQTMLAAPLYVLYEACIWMVWFMERDQAAKGRMPEAGSQTPASPA